MKNIKVYLLLFISSLTIVSCEDDVNPGEDVGISNDFELESRLIVTNEGDYSGEPVGSLTYLFKDDDGSLQIENNPFFNTNISVLGSVLQDAAIYQDTIMYCVMNGSAKVEVVNLNTFERISSITTNLNPRNISIVGDKAYLTTWGGGDKNGTEVQIIDLTDNTINGTIETSNGPEDVVSNDTYTFVSCANYGVWGSPNDTVYVVSNSDNSIYKKIHVGLSPRSMTFDADGNVWVYASENDNQHFTVINGDASDTIKTMSTSQGYPYNVKITSYEEFIYFIGNDGIYRLDKDDTEIPASPFIAGSFYGLGIDTNTGNIFVGTYNYSTQITGSAVEVYSSDGDEISTFSAGIGPNGFYFFD